MFFLKNVIFVFKRVIIKYLLQIVINLFLGLLFIISRLIEQKTVQGVPKVSIGTQNLEKDYIGLN